MSTPKVSERSLVTYYVDIEPLIEVVGSAEMVAIRTGIPRRSVERWKAAGRINLISADRAACALGLYPTDIWGDAWWDATPWPDDEADDGDGVEERRDVEGSRDRLDGLPCERFATAGA